MPPKSSSSRKPPSSTAKNCAPQSGSPSQFFFMWPTLFLKYQFKCYQGTHPRDSLTPPPAVSTGTQPHHSHDTRAYPQQSLHCHLFTQVSSSDGHFAQRRALILLLYSCSTLSYIRYATTELLKHTGNINTPLLYATIYKGKHISLPNKTLCSAHIPRGQKEAAAPPLTDLANKTFQ